MFPSFLALSTSSFTYVQIFSFLKQSKTKKKKFSLIHWLILAALSQISLNTFLYIECLWLFTTHLCFRVLPFGLCPQHTLNRISDISVHLLQRYFKISMSNMRPLISSNPPFQTLQLSLYCQDKGYEQFFLDLALSWINPT